MTTRILNWGDRTVESVRQLSCRNSFLPEFDGEARLSAMELVLDEILDAAFIAVITECPPVEKLIEGHSIQSRATAKEEPAFQGCKLLWGELSTDISKSVSTGEFVERCCFRIIRFMIWKWHNLLSEFAIYVYEFSNCWSCNDILFDFMRSYTFEMRFRSRTSSSWLRDFFSPGAVKIWNSFDPWLKSCEISSSWRIS